MSKKKEVKDLRAGDVVMLDCGYGPHTNDQLCTILRIVTRTGLWGNPIRSAKVEMPDRTRFDTDWGLTEDSVNVYCPFDTDGDGDCHRCVKNPSVCAFKEDKK